MTMKHLYIFIYRVEQIISLDHESSCYLWFCKKIFSLEMQENVLMMT